MWKSRHAGLSVKVRSALETRHPVTGDVIATRPSVWAEFGFATGEQRIINPLTGEMDVLEGFQGGFFDLDSMAEQNSWDDDVKEMVARRLDALEAKQPNTLQNVDYVIPPAAKPWPTYDEETDPEKIISLSATLGLATRALAYERENAQRQHVLVGLEAQLADKPEPVEEEPVIAVTAKRVEEPLVPVDGIPRIATI